MNGPTEAPNNPPLRPTLPPVRTTSAANVAGLPRPAPSPQHNSRSPRRGHSDGDLLFDPRRSVVGAAIPPAQGNGYTGWTSPSAAAAAPPALPESRDEQLAIWRTFLQNLPPGTDPSQRGAAVQQAMARAREQRQRMQEARDTHRRSSQSRPTGIRPPSMRAGSGSYPNFSRPTSVQSLIDGRPHEGAPAISPSNGPTHSASEEHSVPRWQPDSEVAECPICGRAFAFWFRKHHCRKCGRVVCASCSPHRITIPTQYIVRPPTESVADPSNSHVPIIDLSQDDDEVPSPASAHVPVPLEGGREVRLCNPCVPDPNPLPPPSYPGSSSRMESSDPSHAPRVPEPSAQPHWTHASFPGPAPGPRPPDQFGADAALHLPTSSESARLDNRYESPRQMSASYRGENPLGPIPFENHVPARPFQGGSRPPYNYPTPFGSAPNAGPHPGRPYRPSISYPLRPPHQAPQGLPPGIRGPPPHRGPQHRHHVSASAVPGPYHRYQSMLDVDSPLPPYLPPPHPGQSQLQPPQPSPMPQLAEEDECPVCHGELPPKGPNGEETAREAHVAACIETHMTPSLVPAPTSGPQPLSGSATHADAASISPVSPSDEQLAGPSSSAPPAASGLPLPGTDPQSGGGPARATGRRRTNGMFPYLATEKDCVAEDGEAQECVICFEDFEPGVEMGRLECLCKFHRVGARPEARHVPSYNIYWSIHTDQAFAALYSFVVGYQGSWSVSSASGRPRLNHLLQARLTPRILTCQGRR